MTGPGDLTPSELEIHGLAIIERRSPVGEAVRRVYCVRCGSQVSLEERGTDPDWWACPRGCNTAYLPGAALPPARPTT